MSRDHVARHVAAAEEAMHVYGDHKRGSAHALLAIAYELGRLAEPCHGESCETCEPATPVFRDPWLR